MKKANIDAWCRDDKRCLKLVFLGARQKLEGRVVIIAANLRHRRCRLHYWWRDKYRAWTGWCKVMNWVVTLLLSTPSSTQVGMRMGQIYMLFKSWECFVGVSYIKDIILLSNDNPVMIDRLHICKQYLNNLHLSVFCPTWLQSWYSGKVLAATVRW